MSWQDNIGLSEKNSIELKLYQCPCHTNHPKFSNVHENIFFLFDLIFYAPVNKVSVMSGRALFQSPSFKLLSHKHLQLRHTSYYIVSLCGCLTYQSTVFQSCQEGSYFHLQASSCFHKNICSHYIHLTTLVVCVDALPTNQQFFSHVAVWILSCLPELNQYEAADKVPYSRTQHSTSRESGTSNPSIPGLTLYHWPYALLYTQLHIKKTSRYESQNEISNNVVCVPSKSLD